MEANRIDIYDEKEKGILKVHWFDNANVDNDIPTFILFRDNYKEAECWRYKRKIEKENFIFYHNIHNNQLFSWLNFEVDDLFELLNINTHKIYFKERYKEYLILKEQELLDNMIPTHDTPVIKNIKF